jgi:hypothetical protein
MQRGATRALAVCGILWVAACGQSFTSAPVDGGHPDGGGGDGPLSGSDGDATATDVGTDAGAPKPDASMHDDGPACPDEHGSYTLASKGTGCGVAFSDSAPECISQTACMITLVSSAPSSGKPMSTGLNSKEPIAIGFSGGFSSSVIYVGGGTTGVARKDCVGAWKAPDALIVDCGGEGKLGSCTITLTRTGLTCNPP